MREHADAGRIGEREHARSFVDREQIDAVNPFEEYENVSTADAARFSQSS